MSRAYLLYGNQFQRSDAILTASSIDAAFPVGWLRDQLRSKKWRSKSGYNVVAGFNNKLDFKEAGVARVATLAVANYPTPALFAAQVQLAMNAAPGAVNTYVVTYNVPFFTITRNTGAAAVILPFGTGANVASSAHRDLGFTSGDYSGLTSYTGGDTYHSREWVKGDFGSFLGNQAFGQAGAVIEHNLLAAGAGQITLQGNATDVWSAPSVSKVLATADAGIVLNFFIGTGDLCRYWRFLIEDVSNPDGFSEMGIAYLGTPLFTTVGYSINLSNDPEELSTVDFAIQGAHYQDQRPIRNVWSLEWEEIGDNDLAVLEGWEAATPRGKCFFFAFDGPGDPLDTIYCFRASALRKQYVGPGPGGSYWTASVTLAEALG